MHHSVEDSNKLSALIANQVDEFLSRGGEIEVVPIGASKDLESFRSMNTIKPEFKYGNKGLGKVDVEKENRKDNARARKRLERAQEAYELRQRMNTKDVCKELNISASVMCRLMIFYKGYRLSKGLEYELPVFEGGRKRLVKADKIDIAQKYRAGASKQSLITEYRISHSSLNKILLAQGISQFNDGLEVVAKRNAEMRELAESGSSYDELAEKYGLSAKYVKNIVRGYSDGKNK